MSRISQLVAVADDITTEPIPCPEWGLSIDIRSMDGNRRATFLQRFAEAREANEGAGAIEADLVVACAFDPEDGSQAFTGEDIEMLRTKNGAVVGRLARAAMRLSGLDSSSEERLGKDSSASTAAPSDGSTSTSPVS